MKNITQYIIERNSPDKISVTDTNGEKINFYWTEDFARPFLFDIKNNKAIFSKNTCSTHINIVNQIADDDANYWKELGLDKVKRVTDFRYDPKYGSYAMWKRLHQETSDRLRAGRLWDVTWNGKPTLFIAWWEGLTKTQFIKFNTTVVENYVDKNFDEMTGSEIKDYDIYCVDNNGKIFKWEPNNKDVKIEKRTKESQKLMDAAHAIHLATQEEKKNFFANFKKTRDEKNQQIYNHTKSKTEAEYRALKYQESLEE